MNYHYNSIVYKVIIFTRSYQSIKIKKLEIKTYFETRKKASLRDPINQCRLNDLK